MDWIEEFMEYTKDATSPESFRKWCGISAIAGALERRVWVNTARTFLYPNLYILLVSLPGIGKSESMKFIKEFWLSTGTLYVSHNRVTSAAMVDALIESQKTFNYTLSDGTKKTKECSYVLLCASELGTFIPMQDFEILNILNDIFDCPSEFGEKRRTKNVDHKAVNPGLNLISGVTPAVLNKIFPEEAWQMGTTQRMIMVYEEKGPKAVLFPREQENTKLFEELKKGMKHISTMTGQFNFSQEAIETLEKWHYGDQTPKPTHPKLLYYNSRRSVQVQKLAMVSAASRDCSNTIEHSDILRARSWLEGAESKLELLFREVTPTNDYDAIEELSRFVRSMNQMTKKPITEDQIIRFLSAKKIASEKISYVVKIAIQSKKMRLTPDGLMYLPMEENVS